MTTATPPSPAAAMQSLRERVAQLLARERWSRDQLLAHQRERLRSLIEHACERSPYYAEALAPGAADSSLAQLPTLSKDTLVEQWDRIVCDRRLTRAAVDAHAAGPAAGDPYLGEYHVFSSSGASGLRGVFVYSLPDWQVAVASILRCLARAGVPPGARTIGIGAADPVHMSRKALAVLEQAGAEAPPASARTPLPELVATLDAYRPDGLFGYPSIAAALAREQLAGRLRIAPRWLAFGSEPLTAAMRDVIERAWGIDPSEYYASTELPVIAASTPEHPRALDVFEDLAVVEVVDERNRPVPAGTPGAKLLVTNLEQRTLPLIRYELTDRVTLAPGPNPGGRPWATIAAIDGRTADTLSFPARSGGGAVALSPFELAAPFAQLAGVRQYQLVHHDDGLEVRLALDPGAPGDTARRVEDAIARVLADAGAIGPPIRITPVAELEREPGAAAKLKLVVDRRTR